MPTLLNWNGFRFYFFSNEGFEPPHIHVDKGDNSAKIWLSSLVIEHNYGFKEKELNAILLKVSEKQAYFMEAWNEYFNK
ncbi:MAG: DUF4160 domain-containing protein [Pseudomonadota bacterium]